MKSNKLKYSNALWVLNLIWLLLTICLLVGTLKQQWQKYTYQNNKHLQLVANRIELRFSAIINSYRHSIFTLPLYGRELKHCEHDLKPILKSIHSKSPGILGAFLIDKATIICATFDSKFPISLLLDQSLSLQGPMTLYNNQQVFLLLQRLGEYYFGLSISEPVFINFLKQSLAKNDLITLVDNRQQNNSFLVKGNNLIITLGRLETANNLSSNIKSSPKNYGIKIIALPFKPNADFFYHELPLILGLLLTLFLLYLKFRSMLKNRFSLNYLLTQALKLDHFHPIYQPVKDLSSMRFCGAEVLMRWQNKSNEIIMPDLFISDAEQSGLIVPITLQFMEKSFEQTRDLLKRNPDFHLAFNLSANHFTDKDFLNNFYNLCSEFEIPAKQIMLEFTERQLFDQNDKDLVNKMKDLRLRGYSLAIDDFGTGHASIKYLQHFPFNYLKIDQIFIQAIGTGAITETLNQSIIHMAKSLELNIIAEGVETELQIEFLIQSEVKFVQGWYFAKAMSFEELSQIIEEEGKDKQI
ncbi:MAG: EAL domain-containing protein [Tatlockia sp.]|nr:EAL domain-containing protein [Tatlockia sp.]